MFQRRSLQSLPWWSARASYRIMGTTPNGSDDLLKLLSSKSTLRSVKSLKTHHRVKWANISPRNLFTICVLTICALTACLGVPRLCMADDFEDARSLAEGFIGDYESFRNLNKTEVRMVVKAMCDADDDQLDAVSKDVSSRVKADVQSRYDDLDRLQKQVNQALDKVIADDNFQDKRSDARGLKDRVNEVWGRIQRMSEAIRGGNHPVVAYMRQAGQDVHKVYVSEHSSLCTVHEFPIKNRQADCVNSDQCWVVELKPNNNQAVDIGRKHAIEEADALNTDFDLFQELVKRNSDFKKQCWRNKKFLPKVATYIFCPDVDDDGNYLSTSYGWGDPQD